MDRAPLGDECAIERDYFRKFEAYLDKSGGECWLKRLEMGDLVANALRFFDGDRYRLDAWVVMPNHVHALMQAKPGHGLQRIVHSCDDFLNPN